MEKKEYYSSGEFARMAGVTLRTIRYYDKKDILKPSLLTEAGARLYTEEDFARLQQILLLKYLGFSLDDIREMMVDDADYHFLLNSLNIQLKLVQDKIEQMKLVEQAVQNTMEEIQTKQTVDWSHMLHLIHLTSMEKSMINQYHNASNISARINLHSLYSENKKGWFPWIFEQINILPDMKILELGCGNGKLWLENLERLPKDIEIILSDTSEGMLRDARRGIGVEDQRFLYKNFDCHHIPYKNESFDIVIANHMLFYCDDIYKVCEEVKRVLKKGGLFVCGTYGKEHMKEVSQLVTEFDERIVLSAEQLYERFGRENGKEILEKYFNNICWNQYVDKLLIQEPEPLIAYVLSCHGNQSQYLTNHYSEFRNFVKKKTNEKFCVTKDAGVFLCYK